MSAARPLGDDAPLALRAHLRGLADDDAAAASKPFAENALYAARPTGGDETSPRELRLGRAAVLDYLAGRGTFAGTPNLLVCVVEGTAALVEGVIRGPGRDATRSYAASVLLDDDGLIARYVAFECEPAVAPPGADTSATDRDRHEGRDVIEKYFLALAERRFDLAGRCFSDDVVYSHPPYKDPAIAGPGRATFRGREQLVAAFHRRGSHQVGYRIDVSAQRGQHVMVEGTVTIGGTPGGTFLCGATLDGAGLIRRYVAFYCEPAVPRR